MHVTDLRVHQVLGIELAPSGEEHILELADSPVIANHLGTVHAGVQFTLAEACSGEFLLRQFESEKILGVLVGAQVKFRKPARGKLRAAARIGNEGKAARKNRLAAGSRVLITVIVEISDANDEVTMEGRYDWLLQPKSGA